MNLSPPFIHNKQFFWPLLYFFCLRFVFFTFFPFSFIIYFLMFLRMGGMMKFIVLRSEWGCQQKIKNIWSIVDGDFLPSMWCKSAHTIEIYCGFSSSVHYASYMQTINLSLRSFYSRNEKASKEKSPAYVLNIKNTIFSLHGFRSVRVYEFDHFQFVHFLRM